MRALSAEGSERGSRSLATRLQSHGGVSVEGEGSQAARVLARVSSWSKMVSGRYGATRLQKSLRQPVLSLFFPST